jgi:hypothetical protein
MTSRSRIRIGLGTGRDVTQDTSSKSLFPDVLSWVWSAMNRQFQEVGRRSKGQDGPADVKIRLSRQAEERLLDIGI